MLAQKRSNARFLYLTCPPSRLCLRYSQKIAVIWNFLDLLSVLINMNDLTSAVNLPTFIGLNDEEVIDVAYVSADVGL